MKPILSLDKTIRDKVQRLENKCEGMCETLYLKNSYFFQIQGATLIIECVRNQKNQSDILKPNYQSTLEVGMEKNGEYIPCAYMPIWKCKEEWFRPIGYVTEYSPAQIEVYLTDIIEEMKQDI